MSSDNHSDRQNTLPPRQQTPYSSSPRTHITQEPIHEYPYETRPSRPSAHQHTGVASSNDYYMGEPTQMSDTNRYSRYLSTENKHSHSIFIAREQKKRKRRMILICALIVAVIAVAIYFIAK